MTNEQIQEASRLIDEIAVLQAVKPTKGDRFHLTKLRSSPRLSIYDPFDPIAELTPELARDLLSTLIDRKKARLGDLRAGC